MLKVRKCTDDLLDESYNGTIFANIPSGVYKINGHTTCNVRKYDTDGVLINGYHRSLLKFALNDAITLTPYADIEESDILEVSTYKYNGAAFCLDESDIVPYPFITGLGWIIPKQTGYLIVKSNKAGLFRCSSPQYKSVDPKVLIGEIKYISDIDISAIGGLDKQIAEIYRRAFNSRMLPAKVIEELKIEHTRGILLFGPPGTGKTLLARKLAEAIKCNSIQIVNGPELLDKYVGGSESNVRKLFEPAEKDPTGLHVIICDEFDSLCRARGSSQDGPAQDNVVNQFLSKIEGVNKLNNILIIAMTNRKDLIDSALLRPGRFEVHIPVGLPDVHGRHEILKIHTQELRKHGCLASDINLLEIAERLKDYTGAELSGIIRNAMSFATIGVKNTSEIMVTNAHIVKAIEQITPVFGNITDNYTTDNTPVILGKKTLILGDLTDKKINIAKTVAYKQNKTVRIIETKVYYRMPEHARITYIEETFDKCMKIDGVVLIIENIDLLVGWSPAGVRFNNSILQSILAGMQIFQHNVIVTCYRGVRDDMITILELTEYFDQINNV